MKTPTLQQQWLDLEARSLVTDALPVRDSKRSANQILERREALQLARAQNAKMATMAKEYTALSSKVFEVLTRATRGPNGHSWLRDLPNKANASDFYQAMHALGRYLESRSND